MTDAKPEEHLIFARAERPTVGAVSNAMDGRRSSADNPEDVLTLPQNFVVKYLGRRDARGLWGIKFTRKPVDEMVALAKSLRTGETLPLLKLQVSCDGVHLSEMPQNVNKNFESGLFRIDSISYGVQDLVYTRVFAMVIVEDTSNVLEKHPFQCLAFVCDSRQSARQLTLALAVAFKEFSKTIKNKPSDMKPKRFAIDLRSAAELQSDLVDDSEA